MLLVTAVPCCLQSACRACNAPDHQLGSCTYVLDLARREERRQMLSDGLKQGKDAACEAAITCTTYNTCLRPLTQGRMLDPSTRPSRQQAAAPAPATPRQARAPASACQSLHRVNGLSSPAGPAVAWPNNLILLSLAVLVACIQVQKRHTLDWVTNG